MNARMTFLKLMHKTKAKGKQKLKKKKVCTLGKTLHNSLASTYIPHLKQFLLPLPNSAITRRLLRKKICTDRDLVNLFIGCCRVGLSIGGENALKS